MISLTVDSVKMDYPLLTEIFHNIELINKCSFIAIVYYEDQLETIIGLDSDLDSDFFDAHIQLKRYLFNRYEDHYDYRILQYND